MSRLVPLAKGAVIVEPRAPMNREEKIVITSEGLAASVPAAEKSFFRIWHDGGSWKPIGIGSNI